MFALFHHDEQDNEQAEDSLSFVMHSSEFGIEEYEFYEHIWD